MSCPRSRRQRRRAQPVAGDTSTGCSRGCPHEAARARRLERPRRHDDGGPGDPLVSLRRRARARLRRHARRPVRDRPRPTSAFEIVHDNPWDPARMSALVRGYDVVVAQRLPVPTMRALARRRHASIYDLYAPLRRSSSSRSTRARSTSRVPRRDGAELNSLTQEVALATGDAFVCASEKQRDFWLGALRERRPRSTARATSATRRCATLDRRRPVRHRPGAAASQARRCAASCPGSARTTGSCSGRAGSGTGSTRSR